ncbi:hypothetical protein DL93DRAFT_2068260, partial [Clavulina sp. PMI_390]
MLTVIDRASEKLADAFGAKYKPVAVKKRPVPVSLPYRRREPYKPLPEPVLPEFPIHPPHYSQFQYTEKLTKERMSGIKDNIQVGILTEDEVSLLFWVLAQNEDALAFDDSERGTFKEEYFPDYIIETVPHEPWQESPIPIAAGLKDEVRSMLRKQVEAGTLEHADSSYRSRIFVVQKPKG